MRILMSLLIGLSLVLCGCPDKKIQKDDAKVEEPKDVKKEETKKDEPKKEEVKVVPSGDEQKTP